MSESSNTVACQADQVSVFLSVSLLEEQQHCNNKRFRLFFLNQKFDPLAVMKKSLRWKFCLPNSISAQEYVIPSIKAAIV